MLAVADAPLDAAGAVGGGVNLPCFHDEGVVVLASGLACAGKAAADLESLGGRQAHHRLCEVGFKFVEDRLAKPDRDAADDALDDTADAVTLGADFLDPLDHLPGGRGIGAAHGGGVDLGGRDACGVDRGVDVMNGADPGDALVAGVQGADDFPRDDAGGDASDGLARGGAASSFPIPDAVFGLVGEIGMGGPEHGLHLGVGRGAGILVVDGDQDRGAKGLAVEDAREDAACVLLLPRGDDVALAGATTVELDLDLLGGDGEARRAAVDDAADSSSMGFPPSGDAEQGAEDAGHKRGG